MDREILFGIQQKVVGEVVLNGKGRKWSEHESVVDHGIKHRIGHGRGSYSLIQSAILPHSLDLTLTI